MLLVLRIALWLQLLLGLGLSRGLFGMRPLGVESAEGTIHAVVGILAAGLAIYSIRPQPGDTLGMIARFFLLVPLLIGIGLLSLRGQGPTVAVTVIHIVLGVTAVGLVEMYVARRRRAERLGT